MDIQTAKAKKILGKLNPYGEKDYEGEIRIPSSSGRVKFLLCPEGNELNSVLKDLCSNLERIVSEEHVFREGAAKDVFEDVVEDWLQEEESLTFDEFVNQLKLDGVRLLSEGNMILYYDAGDLIGGHAIECAFQKDGKKNLNADIVG